METPVPFVSVPRHPAQLPSSDTGRTHAHVQQRSATGNAVDTLLALRFRANLLSASMKRC